MSNSLTSTCVVAADSDLFVAVKQLWYRNKDYLGFFPEGAFDERADNGQIIAAIDASGSFLGYALLSVSRQKRTARLNHLCVMENARGRGIGALLVEEVRRRTAHCYRLDLSCRKDFPACSRWPSYGFDARYEVTGRAGKPLVVFAIDHDHPKLIPDHVSDDRLDVVLDVNAVLDFLEDGRSGAEETRALDADWLVPLVRLCVCEETRNEFSRHATAFHARLGELSSFHELKCPVDKFLAAQTAVQQLLGPAEDEQTAADYRQVARTIGCGATVFVTRDGPLLDNADILYEHFGIEVLRPSAVIIRLDELQNERQYQRQRMAGTVLSVQQSNDKAEDLARSIEQGSDGYRRKDTLPTIASCLARTAQCSVVTIDDADGRRLAVYCIERTSDQLLTVPLVRLPRDFVQQRLKSSLTKKIILDICNRGRGRSVLVTDAHLEPVLTEAVAEWGFQRCERGWVKLNSAVTGNPAEVVRTLRDVQSDLGLNCADYGDIFAALETPALTPPDAAAVERVLFPAKLTNCQIPSFIIPIQQHWATYLFDAKLADRTLFGADVDLALNPEAAYYRSAAQRVVEGPGRVLWYVSKNDDVPGTKRIRACSRIEEVTVGPAAELFRQNRRLGVYSWSNVLDIADGNPDGEIMVIRFSQTELFPFPIPFDHVQSVLQESGKGNYFQSPVRIPEEVFLKLYRAGHDAAALDPSTTLQGDSERNQDA